MLLVPIYSMLGRIDEAERLLTDRWNCLNETGEGASEQALNLVAPHRAPDEAHPGREHSAYLDRAGNVAPDDDRVWLGEANLAIRTGITILRGLGSMPACGGGPRMSRSGGPVELGYRDRAG